MDKFFGLFGIIIILGIAFLMSRDKKAIDWKLVGTGLGLQLIIAVFVLKIPYGKVLFEHIGNLIKHLLAFADKGGEFVFGVLVNKPAVFDQIFGAGSGFIFAFKIIPTIIFVAVLVNIAYHIGLMQRIVSFVAKIVYKLMGVSGSEALSNVSSAFVGQVEAQIMIKPYVSGMTKSELLASMTGSMACIAGGVMAIYISLGVPAEYLLAASLMAAPGALVISKIVYPETQKSETRGEINLEVKKTHANLIDAISHGASDGMRISINVIAMLIGFLALISMIDGLLGYTGGVLGNIAPVLGINWIDFSGLSLKTILGSVFSLLAWLMGVPWSETLTVGSLMGTKMAINEFVAYMDLAPIIKGTSDIALSEKSVVIASFALCGFANLGSIAIQIGGIGEIAPNRRADLAKLGIRALICGTLASYMSATIAGILTSL
ncbi:MAG TPA: nucleoside transporter C-terminal domain-containing protein [Candidatus Gastranaerophilales bacterium]|nr:nucleoside transporter C-terminal domain-containing protein [Candidatus Gastranaerophilales bacterium]